MSGIETMINTVTDIATIKATSIGLSDIVVVQGHTSLVVGTVYHVDRAYPGTVRIYVTYKRDGVDQYELVSLDRDSDVAVVITK